MTGFALHAFLTGMAITAGADIALFTLTWALGIRLGRFNIVDVTWGLSFLVVAALSFGLAGPGTNFARQLLVLTLVSIWALRLSGYIAHRSRGQGEDPRYAELLAKASSSRARYALAHIYLPQALIAWFVSLPVQAAMNEREGLGAITVVGAMLWLVGMTFEAVGDAQLSAFKRDPANTGKVMERGLWRYSRHPNYFGEACLWTGFYLLATAHWIGAATILSPIAMTYFVAFKTGKPLLESRMAATKAGYAEYAARTSGFFPLPPRRRPYPRAEGAAAP